MLVYHARRVTIQFCVTSPQTPIPEAFFLFFSGEYAYRVSRVEARGVLLFNRENHVRMEKKVTCLSPWWRSFELEDPLYYNGHVEAWCPFVYYKVVYSLQSTCWGIARLRKFLDSSYVPDGLIIQGPQILLCIE